MKSRVVCLLALPALVLVFMAFPGVARQPKGDDKDKEAIGKKGEAFIEAFHKGEAKNLAGFWTKEGDFTDQAGRHLKGRAAIEKAFSKLFADNKDLKLHIESESLRFVTPDVAIEDGTTEIVPSNGGLTTKARYTIVHVKEDGRWLISSLRNSPVSPTTQFDHLRDLSWLIGDWASEPDKGKVERLSFAWGENENYIVGAFSTTVENVSVGSAKQWIGWDPVAKRVQSRIIDATGAFGEGQWAPDGKMWVVKTTIILPDGKKAAGVFVLAPIDADTISLLSREQNLEGSRLPVGKEFKLKRVK
jgi:uncharacterized protein (TIGR02246 family)